MTDKTSYLLPVGISVILALLPVSWGLKNVSSQSSLANKLEGSILLQVEQQGRAWYVNPSDHKRYYLSRPGDAYNIMKNMGTGITEEDLSRIPIGVIDSLEGRDSDGDGLRDSLEKAISSDPNKKDTDNDGYSDKQEIINNYDPTSSQEDKKDIDPEWSRGQAGRIFLQTHKNGEAWYINPGNNKRYFLGSPRDAWRIMKKLSVGITNHDLKRIEKGGVVSEITEDDDASTISTTTNDIATSSDPQEPTSTCSDCLSAASTMDGAAQAIKNGDEEKAVKYFTPQNKKAVISTVETLDEEQRFLLANIMAGAGLAQESGSEKIYTEEVFISMAGEKTTVKFRVKKQDDKWLLTNL